MLTVGGIASAISMLSSLSSDLLGQNRRLQLRQIDTYLIDGEVNPWLRFALSRVLAKILNPEAAGRS